MKGAILISLYIFS